MVVDSKLHVRTALGVERSYVERLGRECVTGGQSWVG